MIKALLRMREQNKKDRFILKMAFRCDPGNENPYPEQDVRHALYNQYIAPTVMADQAHRLQELRKNIATLGYQEWGSEILACCGFGPGV